MPQTAESIGAITQADPNSVGAKPTEAALTEAGRVMHPVQQASAPDTGGAPGPAPGAADAEPSDADWKATLRPEDAKRVDQIVTKLRQEDSGKIRELEAQTQRLAWADDLNRMVASENPQDRQRAVALLKATLSTLEQFPVGGVPDQDPLAGVDWQNVDAIAPGLSKTIQHIVAQNQAFAKMLGETHEVATATAERAARADFDREVTEIEEFARKNNLPFDVKKVMATEDKLNITDLRSAYFATYGQELIDAGKKASDAALTRRKEASLPGGTAGGGAPTRPKFKSMHEQWEWLKRERGIQGPIEYKG